MQSHAGWAFVGEFVRSAVVGSAVGVLDGAVVGRAVGVVGMCVGVPVGSAVAWVGAAEGAAVGHDAYAPIMASSIGAVGSAMHSFASWV